MSSGFKALRAHVAHERKEWEDIWASWPDREVMAHPAYCELFARTQDTALCCVMRQDKGTVIFPAILRPLAGEPWVTADHEWFDLTTPYGYGGAFALGKPDPELFWRAFRQWTHRAKLVSAFVRLSLFPSQLIPFDGTVSVISTNVVRRLDLPLDGIWRSYEHKVRKNVNKAVRHGLELVADFTGSSLDEFLVVYNSTMERRGAADFYYFNEGFFRMLISGLPGQFGFFHALKDGKTVSTELVLISQHRIYSFLGGTLAEAFDLRANDFLKHSIVTWGVEHGKKEYVLGGGYKARDGIFRYKLSFAPDGEVDFRAGTEVYDQDVYAAMISMRSRWEASRNMRDWVPEPGFFPQYRG